MSQELSIPQPHLPPPTRGALDLPLLAQNLPTDVTSFRALCDTLEALEDEVGPHLDAFSSLGLREGSSLDREALVSLFRRRRRELELAVLVLSEKLARAPLRSVYLGQLLASLCQYALGRRGSESMNTLLSGLEQRAPLAWERLVDSLHAVLETTDNWARWPTPEVSRPVVLALEDLTPAWADVLPMLKSQFSGGRNRERRRDPAYKRAVNWHEFLLGLFRRLAVPGGPLRIIVDYHLAVIAYFDHAIANPTTAVTSNNAACDLLILEVFDNVEQLSLCDDELDGPPRFLEQGVTKRRKRIQRARLQVMIRWEVFVDDVTWIEWVYPGLCRIPQLRAGQLEPASASVAPAPDELRI